MTILHQTIMINHELRADLVQNQPEPLIMLVWFLIKTQGFEAREVPVSQEHGDFGQVSKISHHFQWFSIFVLDMSSTCINPKKTCIIMLPITCVELHRLGHTQMFPHILHLFGTCSNNMFND